jgi:hypothetical protein
MTRERKVAPLILNITRKKRIKNIVPFASTVTRKEKNKKKKKKKRKEKNKKGRKYLRIKRYKKRKKKSPPSYQPQTNGKSCHHYIRTPRKPSDRPYSSSAFRPIAK